MINKHVAKIILASIWKVNSMGYCNFDKFWLTLKFDVEFSSKYLYYMPPFLFFAIRIVELFNKHSLSLVS